MCIFGHFRPNIGIFGNRNRIFGPKKVKFGPICAFLVILGQILAFLAHFVPRPRPDQKTMRTRRLCVFVLYVGTKTLVVARGLYLARHLFNLYYLNFKGKNVNISDRFDESEILFRFANRCRSDN